MSNTRIPLRLLLVAVAAGAVIAAGLNTMVYLCGRAADLEFLVDESTGEMVRLGHVLGATSTSFALGLIVAGVANRLGRPRLVTVQVVAAALAIVSIGEDLVIDASAAAKATLAAMHLVAGAVYVTALHVASTRLRASAAPLATAHQPASENVAAA
jgi:hypothetical protein